MFMKLKFTFLLSLVCTFYFSQNHRFVYEFRYKTDTISQKENKAEMVLDIQDNNVQFYDYYAIEIDSANQNSNGYSTYTLPFPNLKRKMGAFKNNNYYLLDDAYLVYETDDKIVWNITKETKQKDKWKLQKATSDFRGRKWEAWFTSDLPFSEGPYKFNNLPGLVVEVKDSKNNFVYELVRIENPKKVNENIVETVFKKKPLKVSFAKYQDLMIAYYNDPYSRYRNMKAGTWAIGRDDESFVETIDGLNKITKEDQERILKNNNQIEKDRTIKYITK